MESNFAQQMKEEYISKKIGKQLVFIKNVMSSKKYLNRIIIVIYWVDVKLNYLISFFSCTGLMEDLEDMRQEAEDKKIKKKRKTN